MKTTLHANVAGGGAIYAIESNIYLNSTSSFVHNRGTDRGGAIHVIRSNLFLFGMHNFSKNYAPIGGAISMQYDSQLVFRRSSRIAILDNKAVSGASIHVEDIVTLLDCISNDLLETYVTLRSPCFFNVIHNAHNIIWSSGNSDTTRSSVLFGGKLQRCRNKFALRYFFNLYINQTEHQLNKSISSEPYQTCFCEKSQNSYSLSCNINQTVVKVSRGQHFVLSLVAVDELDKPVNATIRAELLSSTKSNSRLSRFESSQVIGDSCTNITYHVFSDSKQNSEDLIVFAEGLCNRLGTAGKTVKVVFFPCPDGFHQDRDACVCEKRLQKYTSQCNVDSLTIRKDSDFWVGSLYSNGTYIGLVLYPHCPFDYCKTEPVYITLIDSDKQCNFNRSGVLCGGCLPNYSLTFGNLRCSVCSDQYIALVLVFLTAGVILVFLILLLKLTVANGMFNGLVFYANIIAVNKDIFFLPGESNWLKVFIAWVNLDFGIQTCFFHGMDMYIHTWLQFLFPMYVWTLIAIVIVSSKHSTWITKKLGSNPVAALATLFLLSYAKLLRTIITVFYYAEVQYPNGQTEKVWFYDGTVAYFSGKHIPLFLFAFLFFLIFFLPYNILLVFSQYFQYQSGRVYQSKVKSLFHKLLFSWYEDYRIQAFMDTYNVPYNLDYRFWTGLLLLVRCMLFLVFAFNVTGNPSTNLLVIATSTLGILVLTRLMKARVYKSRITEALEASYLLNLGVFSIATYHNRLAQGNQNTLANIAVGIAFASFILVCLFHPFHSQILTVLVKTSLKWQNIKTYVINWKAKRNAGEGDEMRQQLVPIDKELQPVVTMSVITVPQT